MMRRELYRGFLAAFLLSVVAILPMIGSLHTYSHIISVDSCSEEHHHHAHSSTHDHHDHNGVTLCDAERGVECLICHYQFSSYTESQMVSDVAILRQTTIQYNLSTEGCKSSAQSYFGSRAPPISIC